ncbi:MAG: Na/Pi symporter [Halioglobus sp.]
MNELEVIGSFVAGLGLFFVGIKTLTTHLAELTGRRFRRLLDRSTRRPLLAALGGAALGATMQTGSAITFILVGMVSAGMISVERSLPVRLGAAVGTSAMVFIATMDIKIFILFIVGIAGISLAQIRSPKPFLGVLFGGGVMFFGLDMVGESAAYVTAIPWFEKAITGVNGAPLTAFFMAGILSLAIQSPQSVAILAIAMTVGGVLDTWTTLVIIYGCNLGGGLSTYLMATGLRGTSRQITIFQVWFNVITAGLLLLLFFLERSYGVPLVHALVTSLKVETGQQMAFVYLIYNVLGAIIMFVFRAPILKKIEHWCPPSLEEDIGKLQYLHDHAIDTPNLALELAEKEELRFLAFMPQYIEPLRDKPGSAKLKTQALGRALNQLHKAIEEALGDLGQHVRPEDSERLINLVNRNRVLGSLHGCIEAFCSSVSDAQKSTHLSPLAMLVTEAFDATLGNAIEAAQDNDLEDLTLAWTSTDDKSDKMRNIRQRFLMGDFELSDNERLDLMALTTGLERAIWVLHEYLGELVVADERQIHTYGAGN